MSEYDGIIVEYIPQCACCEYVDGYGCKAFRTQIRERKYYDSRDADFCKCPKFRINQLSPQAKRFRELSKNYNWGGEK